MSEWNENRLNQELEAIMKDMPESDDLEDRISRSINRKIQKVVIRTVSAIVIIILVAFLLINPVMNRIFFNPYKLNEEPKQKMLGVMRDYVETVYPYREVISLNVSKRGFGRYELAMQVADLTEPINIGADNVWCEVNWGKYENVKDADSNMTQNVGRFTCDYEDQEEMIRKIEELPKSAEIYLSVSDIMPKSIEELRKLSVEPVWIQVYQPDVDVQAGMNLNICALYAEDDRRAEMSEQELLDAYLSNLENMLENTEVWEGLGLSDGSNRIYVDSKGALTKTYEDAKTLTSLTSENYCVYGKRDEVICFLQENKLDSIYVENVSLW